MAAADDINAQVDLTSDLGDIPNTPSVSTPTNVEDNGGTRQAGTDDEPLDVRSLLNKAFKEDATGRLHAEDGKFAPKTPQEQAAEQQQQQAPPQEQQQQQAAPQDQAAAIISALPEEHRAAVQNLLQTRETAWQQHVQQLSDRVRGYDSIEQLIGPRRNAWAINGMSPDVAISQLLALSDFAGRDPSEFIAWFANQHNIDLDALSASYIPPNPEVVALQKEIQQLRQGQQQVQSQQQSATHNAYVNEVTTFAQMQGQDGNLAHPHFEEVANDILQMVPVIKAQNPNAHPQAILKEAYERAVWANPVTRAKAIQSQQSVAEAQRLQEAAKRAANARQAGSSLTGAPVSETPSQHMPQADTVRGALEAAIAQHS